MLRLPRSELRSAAVGASFLGTHPLILLGGGTSATSCAAATLTVRPTAEYSGPANIA
jgi:hypothetical protein